jgi:hypothetical protein
MYCSKIGAVSNFVIKRLVRRAEPRLVSGRACALLSLLQDGTLLCSRRTAPIQIVVFSEFGLRSTTRRALPAERSIWPGSVTTTATPNPIAFRM